MADPTSAVTLAQGYKVEVNRQSFLIKTSEALVRNALVSVDVSTNEVEFADDAANLVPAGLCEGPVDGNVDHLTGNGTYKANCIGGISVYWSVTGVTSTTDVGKFVYATDGQTLTLTRPTTGLPHGFIVEHVTGTYCWVYFFSHREALEMSRQASGDYEIMDLGIVSSNTLGGTSALTLLTLLASTKHYKFISFHAQPLSYDTGLVVGSQVLNLEIAGTDVTGGVLTLTFEHCDAAADLGANVSATAITAANEVHIGDIVQVEMAAGGTGFTAAKLGAFKLLAVIQKLPGA